MKRQTTLRLSVLLIGAIALSFATWFYRDSFSAAPKRESPTETASVAAPTFVDEQQCARCHTEQFAAWRTSHHALAMQTPTPDTVAGDFNNRPFSGSGSSAHFARTGAGEFVVTTDDAAGRKTDYPVKYVFGVEPLQQYLLELPRGKLQALSIAWDTQNKQWFHLYPHETIKPHDPLHWTQPAQNWNFMCAECHSTEVEKNYDSATDTYATSWFQINVGCQACHGPGSNHLQWATSDQPQQPRYGTNKGFAFDFRSTVNTVQIEVCARCHSRRSVIAPHYEYGKRLLDFYRPALLEENLYHADGQQQDEVYEYGSFVQSKMARKGVRCSDCHNPHSATLRAPDNALCASCHNTQGATLRAGIDSAGLQKKNYDSAEHHFHAPGTAGSHCIECHAPAKNYMVVDARIDHSFRIPRPDLTAKIGTPNACNQCHDNQSPQWALAQIQKHHPDFATDYHYGEALAAGRNAGAGAAMQLRDVIVDARYAPIVRASALRLLPRYPGAFTAEIANTALRDTDPLVRVEAVSNFSTFPVEERPQWLTPLLRDPVRAVRIESARLLAPLLPQTSPQTIAGLTDVINELEASYTTNFDRPESRMGLADLRVAQARYDDAEHIYRETFRLWPSSLEAAVNLAELYHLQAREREAETLLRATVSTNPNNAVAVQALAFSLIRQQRKDEAIAVLEQAAKAQPGAELAYILGLALIDAGQQQRGIKTFEAALAHAPGDRELLLALATQAQSAGDAVRVQHYLQRLRAINPNDPALPHPN